MPLLDELISHFRGEAQRLAETPFAAEVVADLKSLEGIAAKRAQAAQAAFHLAETDVRDWLAARLHNFHQPQAAEPVVAAGGFVAVEPQSPAPPGPAAS